MVRIELQRRNFMKHACRHSPSPRKKEKCVSWKQLKLMNSDEILYTRRLLSKSKNLIWNWIGRLNKSITWFRGCEICGGRERICRWMARSLNRRSFWTKWICWAKRLIVPWRYWRRKMTPWTMWSWAEGFVARVSATTCQQWKIREKNNYFHWNSSTDLKWSSSTSFWSSSM